MQSRILSYQENNKIILSFTENTTAVFSSCLPDGTWSLVTFTCMYDPRAVSKSNIGGLSLDWEAGSQMNISTMITIGVLSALIVHFWEITTANN